MGKLGKEVADLIGPPDDEEEGGGKDMAGEAEGGDEEAQVSAMADYRAALKSGTDEEALQSLKDLLDLID